MSMRWMVGIDLAGRHEGAVAFAKWIAGRAPGDRFVGAHVIEAAIAPLLVELEVERREEAIRNAATELIDPLRRLEIFSDLGTISATTAEDGLEAAAQKDGCNAMLLGRRKPSQDTRLFRLGRVARRLLRHLPTPIVVVPPDLARREMSEGPILLASDLGPASAGAAAFSKKLAAALDLEILVTHVAGPPTGISPLLPADDWGTLVEAVGIRGRAALAAWVSQMGLDDARTSIVEGDAAYAVLEVAKVSGASMIVVGSRGLSAFDRIFASSVGTELAAQSPIPVAVVPPPGGEEA